MTEPIEGICFFHSETGTEGGYWAVQDAKFIGLADESRSEVCVRCGAVWNHSRDAAPPKVTFTYWRPDWSEGEKNYMGGHYSVDEPRDDLPLARPGDKRNAEYMRRDNESRMPCYLEGHPGWEPMFPDGQWSYEGLNVLTDGDYLEIRHPETDNLVWSGTIALHHHKLFTEDAEGLWIHADQDGISRDDWSQFFFEEYKARLWKGGK